MLLETSPIHTTPAIGIDKSPTGIGGLDQLTAGGLPSGRPTLICGGPGCGKSLMAMTFLVNGAVSYGENGVFVSFEERRDDPVNNVASLGYDLDQLTSATSTRRPFIPAKSIHCSKQEEDDRQTPRKLVRTAELLAHARPSKSFGTTI